MGSPALVVIDDDTATEGELRKRYGADYQVMAYRPAEEALDALPLGPEWDQSVQAEGEYRGSEYGHGQEDQDELSPAPGLSGRQREWSLSTGREGMGNDGVGQWMLL